jgi:hypothetical protein
MRAPAVEAYLVNRDRPVCGYATQFVPLAYIESGFSIAFAKPMASEIVFSSQSIQSDIVTTLYGFRLPSVGVEEQIVGCRFKRPLSTSLLPWPVCGRICVKDILAMLNLGGSAMTVSAEGKVR